MIRSKPSFLSKFKPLYGHAIKNLIKFQYQNRHIWTKLQSHITERDKHRNKAFRKQSIFKFYVFFSTLSFIVKYSCLTFFNLLLSLLDSRLWHCKQAYNNEEYAFSESVDKERAQSPSDWTEYKLRNTKLQPGCCIQEFEHWQKGITDSCLSQTSPQRNQVKLNCIMDLVWKDGGEKQSDKHLESLGEEKR